MNKSIVFLTLSLLTKNITLSQINYNYPQTPKENVTDNYFGTVVKDPYRWLEDDKSPRTNDWVKKENTVTENYLKQIIRIDVNAGHGAGKPTSKQIAEFGDMWSFVFYNLGIN
jgi:hypothetical protein